MKFCNLELFENYVIKENKNDISYYILTSYFDYYHNKNGIFLSRVSIFDNLKRGTIYQDKNKVDKILKILMNPKFSPQEKSKELNLLNVTDKEKKGIGSMLGMAIGDAMGARLEFHSLKYNKIDLIDMGKGPESHFHLYPGQWTDDTSMGLCLADSLLMNKGQLNPKDLMHRFIAWWKGGYNNSFRFNIENNNMMPRPSIGLGGNIYLSFSKYIKDYDNFIPLSDETKAGNKDTSGNGSIMRNAAIPICFHYDINKACEMARRQSLVTHQGIEAKECCSLLTYIIVKIFEGKKLKEEILEYLDKGFITNVKSVDYLAKSKQEGNDINRNWDWKKKEQYIYSPHRSQSSPGYIGSYAMDNMAMSLNIIYNTNSFKEAIIKAVNLRGDADSVASVVGQIAGAYYPIENIPYDWIQEIYRWDRGEIALRGYMLARLRNGYSYIIN